MMDKSGDSILVAGIAMETAYAGFTRGKLTDNELENPGLGYTIDYHGSDQGEATVYIYSLCQRDIPNGPNSEVIVDQLNQASRDLIGYNQTVGRRAELVSRYGTGSPDRGAEFLCAEFILTDDFRAWRTFVYVTGCAKNFVKIRVTLRTNDGTDPTARNFADAFARQLWGRG